MREPHDLVIIGSGPAGYTAALYAGRAGLSPVVFTGAPTLSDPNRLPGGQLVTTSVIDNFPGFPEGIGGPALTDQLRAQAERHGAIIRDENVVSVDLSARPFAVTGETAQLAASAVVLATGASARWLGVAGEEEYKGRGVSACATCDGPLFPDRDVVVVGGGDTALEEALYLARIARSVRVVHRRGELRASRVMQERARQHPRIRLVLDRAVEAILGDGEAVTGLRLRGATGGAAEEVAADAVFVAIGHTPAVALVEGQLALDERGYVATVAGSTRTSVPGVFACGDVADPIYRQAITAAGTGCMAALDAERWLAESTIARAVTPLAAAA